LGADAVFDLSGGDSFTDLYGDQRFEFICQTKEMVLDAGCPLILPPQTFGPYANEAKRARVAEILARAQQVWARDQPSLQRADELLEEFGYSPCCRLGVDLAFALPASNSLPTNLSRPLDDAGLIVGMNVSGLMWHREGIEARRLESACDYRKVVVQGIRELLSSGVDQLLLVPHVLEAPGSNESDPAAAAAVMERLPAELQKRVVVLSPPFGPEAAKALVARCAWFAGTRMHATIGALSMGVPTTALAYSLKFQGVFDLVGMGHRVIDLRESSTSACLEALHEGFTAREEDRVAMAPGLQATKVRALSQVADMLVNARG
jgi:polysaccharide pyruvyl transferase WcaK-like protein